MWILRLFNSGIRGTFVTKYLKLADNYNELKRTVRFKKFMRSYLRHDGTFVLKMIALNCGDIICSEIIQNLWTDYKSKCAEAQQPQEQGGLRRSSCMLRLSCNNLNEQPKTRRGLQPIENSKAFCLKMVANELINQYKALPKAFNYIGLEDFPDRLNFLFTVTVLLVCCSVVTVRTYVFHPLACYIPNMFGSGTAGQELFVNNYCWTEGTFAVHPRQFSIDATQKDGGLGRYRDKRITYYQWVPLVLGVQCIMFYLPRVLWNFITNQRSGTDVAHIVRTVRDAIQADREKHNKLMQHACARLEQLLSRSHQFSQYSALRSVQQLALNRFGLVLSTQPQGNTIICSYLAIKTLYFINASCQLVIMQRFLNLNNTEYGLFGLRLLGDLSSGIYWENSMVFPRVGSCAVYMKTAGVGNWQMSQCALPINMINEKIYIFPLRNNPWLKKFELEFLRNDGTFLLKMIALNCGDLACTEILRRLWIRFLRSNGVHKAEETHGDQGVSVKNLVVISTAGLPEQARVKKPKLLLQS
uniref:Innexin n=1 Tax=Macrostomum lignano TaxID=282301 RepID=A0A1I8G5G7_9PLAT